VLLHQNKQLVSVGNGPIYGNIVRQCSFNKFRKMKTTLD